MVLWGIFVGTAIIVGVTLGILEAKEWMKKPLVIKFPYSPENWIPPILFSFAMLLALFAIELGGVFWFCEKYCASCKMEDMVFKALENGLAIPFICAAVSRVFEKMVEMQNLDYLELYSKKVSKICFSILMISFSGIMLGWCLIFGKQADPFYPYLANRIIMWFISVLGIWIGFGFGCEGRIERENRKIREANSKIITPEIKRKFWGPILICLFMCDLMMAISFNKTVSNIILVLLIGVMAFVLTLVLRVLGDKDYYLAPNKGLDSFLKAKGEYEAKGSGKGQYGRIHYKIENNDLIIEEMNVNYEEHQEDQSFKNLFGKQNEKFTDLDEAFKKIEKLHKEQGAYIKKGYEDCIEAERQKKLIKIEKRKE